MDKQGDFKTIFTSFTINMKRMRKITQFTINEQKLNPQRKPVTPPMTISKMPILTSAQYTDHSTQCRAFPPLPAFVAGTPLLRP